LTSKWCFILAAEWHMQTLQTLSSVGSFGALSTVLFARWIEWYALSSLQELLFWRKIVIVGPKIDHFGLL